MTDEKKMAFLLIARVRRGCRIAAQQCARLTGSQRSARRRANRLRAANEGNEQLADLLLLRSLEDGIRVLDQYINSARSFLATSGQMLRVAAPFIDRTLTLDEKCDALDVNPVDRVGLPPDVGIVNLAFAYALENSAMRRRQDRKQTPLFDAVFEALAEFCDSPAGAPLAAEIAEFARPATAADTIH
ncbi:hypothetical protein NE850_11600 [Paraburkholderia sp. USG1]|uniref:hypothetical protein n=1 Tax=Paraburkholderia sp. USG1 TaxID=2952268 RepID=UPI002859B3BA|nr:hypothetical protein [Paraburkholderia sp. USG1]MDR8396984.1 hypothetical protein [Paraburkholderia sp. USG1]